MATGSAPQTGTVHRPEFRSAFFVRDYEASIWFYRDGLGFPVLESWNRGANDRGTMFVAASGIVEVLARPDQDEGSSPWDHRSPQGVMLVVEVDDAQRSHEHARAKGLPISSHLVRQPWGHLSFCVNDPDGLMLYLFQRV
jgi:catechol 2,3-dioxygenase-like lactoylglutathione lyase family enzyme